MRVASKPDVMAPPTPPPLSSTPYIAPFPADATAMFVPAANGPGAGPKTPSAPDGARAARSLTAAQQKRIEDELTCPVCLDFYQNPVIRMPPCHAPCKAGHPPCLVSECPPPAATTLHLRTVHRRTLRPQPPTPRHMAPAPARVNVACRITTEHTSVRTVIFWDLINEVLGVCTELIGY